VDAGFIIIALAMLAGGLLVGWLLGGRHAQTKLAAVEADCAGLKAAQVERDRAFEERLRELREAREALTAQFSEIGGKLLGEAQKHFLERADARSAPRYQLSSPRPVLDGPPHRVAVYRSLRARPKDDWASQAYHRAA